MAAFGISLGASRTTISGWRLGKTSIVRLTLDSDPVSVPNHPRFHESLSQTIPDIMPTVLSSRSFAEPSRCSGRADALVPRLKASFIHPYDFQRVLHPHDIPYRLYGFEGEISSQDTIITNLMVVAIPTEPSMLTRSPLRLRRRQQGCVLRRHIPCHCGRPSLCFPQ